MSASPAASGMGETPNYSNMPPPSYNNDKVEKSSDKAPFFNGDPTMFPFWKTKMYSYIIASDDDLWDLVEDGVQFENMDEEGIVKNTYRKLFSAEQKKEYRRHHKVKNILIGAMTHDEYLRITNKSSAQAIWYSLCSTYEGNKQVKEAKANLLVHQYELFKMKDDENIETIFSRFKILVSGLQVLKKSYTASDHLKKILRSLPPKWRPKVTAFQEAKDLDNVTLEDLISSLRSHELELMSDEPVRKSKSLALSSTKSSSKALKAKVIESNAEASEEMLEEDSEEDEMALMTRRFQQLNMKFKKFSNRSSGSRSSGFKDKKEDLNKCFNCKKPGHFIADCPEKSSRDKVKGKSISKERFKNKVKKGLMATWEDINDESDDDTEEEANLALMATASEDNDSDTESDEESDEELEVFSNLTQSELVNSLKTALKHYALKSKHYKILKRVYNDLNES
ncbi:gag-protease polyprotein [Trifolium repens]|nr:gag-protease polyprotein [Trifolium repens]